jgi:hypothetical protein
VEGLSVHKRTDRRAIQLHQEAPASMPRLPVYRLASTVGEEVQRLGQVRREGGEQGGRGPAPRANRGLAEAGSGHSSARKEGGKFPSLTSLSRTVHSNGAQTLLGRRPWQPANWGTLDVLWSLGYPWSAWGFPASSTRLSQYQGRRGKAAIFPACSIRSSRCQGRRRRTSVYSAYSIRLFQRQPRRGKAAIFPACSIRSS